jgi:hypothetical protein
MHAGDASSPVDGCSTVDLAKDLGLARSDDPRGAAAERRLMHRHVAERPDR